MRVLILGGTGMLGHNLLKRLQIRFPDVWATVRCHSTSVQGLGIPREGLIQDVDVTDFTRLNQVLDANSPDVIVNAIAVTKRREGEKGDPAAIAEVIRVNSELPHRLAAWASPRKARVIHFSTDCVFDGKRGGYTESDLPNADDLYGRSKALGEIGEAEGRCLTLRSSLIGRELRGHTELLEWFLSQSGKRVKGFRQAVFSGLASWVMSDLVGELIESHPDLVGMYQVASEPINKYELLCLTREAFGLPMEIVPDDGFVCRRNLDGSRFRRLTGWSAPSWPEMLKGIADGN